MGKILLKSVLTQNAGEKPVRKDVLIDGNRFSKISDQVSLEEAGNAEVVDCKNFALLPAFYNGHTHAAMGLLRGYADDMEAELLRVSKDEPLIRYDGMIYDRKDRLIEYFDNVVMPDNIEFHIRDFA